MNISFEKKSFIEAVYKVARFAERKAGTLPVLSSVLILADETTIKLRATNLEVSIDYLVPGVIRKEGVAAIPATTLQQIASSFTGEGVVFVEHISDQVSITSGSNKTVLKTIPYEDFPSLPLHTELKNTFSVSGTSIKTILSTIGACASNSTIRPELASIYMVIEGGLLTVVATDSFRLAEKKLPISNKGIQGTLLIPAKNALEIAQALPDTEIELGFDDHQVVFSGEWGSIVSRLTNAVYPDYQQIIPKDSVSEVVVLQKDFESALKRTAIFSDAFQKVSLTFDTKKNTLTLFAKNQDVGEASEVVSAKTNGEHLTLSFNHRFLSAVHNLTTAEHITLRAAGIGRPLVIRGVGDNSLLYLISPMNQ